MSTKKLFFSLVLSFLIPLNHLHAFDIPDFIEYQGIKGGYPSASFAIKTANKAEDLMHATEAKQLTCGQQLTKARTLYQTKSWQFFHYFNALINDSKAPSMFRDKAIIERADALFSLLPGLSRIHTTAQLKKGLWADNLRCLHFLIDKPDTLESERIGAFVTLADYYDPRHQHSLSPTAKNVEHAIVQALSYQLEPLTKASLLNNIASLYHNKYLGEGEGGLKTAFNYYDRLDQDEALPIERRLMSRLEKVKVLWSSNSISEAIKVAQLLADHKEASPSLKRQAQFFDLHLCTELACEHFEPSYSVMTRYLQLNDLKKNLSFFNTEQMQLLTYDYAYTAYLLKFYYQVDQKTWTSLLNGLQSIVSKPGDENVLRIEVDAHFDNELLSACEEVLHQNNPPFLDYWAKAVIVTAEILSKTEKAHLPCLRKKSIGDLLNTVINENSISLSVKNQAKTIKAVLVAKELLTKAKKNADLQDLYDALVYPHLSKPLKLEALQIVAQATQKLYPTYNKHIGKFVNYLKNLLKEPLDVQYQKKIKFILYTYFQAYDECPLTAEEVAEYVEDLSSEDTPEAYRIHITADDDSEETEDSKEENNNVEKTTQTTTLVTSTPVTSLALLPVNDLPDIYPSPTTASTTSHPFEQTNQLLETHSDQEDEEETNSPAVATVAITPQTTVAVTPAPVVSVHMPLPINNPKLKRNLKHAKLLLERLKTRRGKVSQSEVTNLLRRLNYTFQPTADHGLTIHLGHKGRNNKKGATGQLDGGRKTDLSDVLQDAIDKAEKDS